MAHRRSRRRFTREYKAQSVQRLIESGRPLADIAAELDVSPGQLSQWRHEQLAAGSAEALAARKAIAAWLTHIPTEVADGVSFCAHEGDTGRRHAKGQASR